MLTSVEEPCSWHTCPFPNLAVPRAHAFGLELACDNSCILRAAQTRDQPAFIHMQLGEDGEDGGCAAAATTPVFVGAHGLCWAWVCGEGERVG